MAAQHHKDMAWEITTARPGGVGGTYSATVKKPRGYTRMGPIATAAGDIYELTYRHSVGAAASRDTWNLGVIWTGGPETRRITVRTTVAGTVMSTIEISVTR